MKKVTMTKELALELLDIRIMGIMSNLSEWEALGDVMPDDMREELETNLALYSMAYDALSADTGKLEKPLNVSGIKKVVINTCFGGYSLSEKVVLKFNEESGAKMSAMEASYKIPRDDDLLIRIIEEVGVEDAGGLYADLKIIEIPDDIEFVISEYEGKETVHETRRTWW